jgi:hypothetical protein
MGQDWHGWHGPLVWVGASFDESKADPLVPGTGVIFDCVFDFLPPAYKLEVD